MLNSTTYKMFMAFYDADIYSSLSLKFITIFRHYKHNTFFIFYFYAYIGFCSWGRYVISMSLKHSWRHSDCVAEVIKSLVATDHIF
jgi:hypothetical protein